MILRGVARHYDADPAAAARIEDYYARVQAATDLEKSLRVAAVMHHAILRDDPRVAELRPWYATVGGSKDPEDAEFATRVEAAVARMGDELFERALTWRVQTNETARGLAWLLPMAVLDVDAVHLVELGASAGLNLYADQRSYRVKGEGAHASVELRLGRAEDTQFEIPAKGLGPLAALELQTPEVVSRHGGDAHPIDVEDADAMDGLRACIWGDQPQRFRRLEEALALHAKMPAEARAQLHKSELPGDLESLLGAALPGRPEAPVVLFNTYVTAYFSDVQHREMQRRVRRHARQEALTHRVPWVWIRFEPARRGDPKGPQAAWCRWRAELWYGREHTRIELGWAHPHMAEIEFGEGLEQLCRLREGAVS